MPALRKTLPIAVAVSVASLSFTGASAYTPNPERVVYISRADGDQDVYTMNPDGSGRTGPLTKNNVSDCDPVFSPDGTQIAYVGTLGEQVSQLWVMNTDGSSPQQLTFGVLPDYVRDPTWSPDGRAIVFHRGHAPGAEDEDHHLGIVRRADNGMWGTEEVLVNGDAWAWSPAFSSQGRIAFQHDADRGGPVESDVWETDADGTTPTPLLVLPGWEGSPSWSSDESKLVYTDFYVFMYDFNTHQERQLSTRSSGHPEWSTNRDEIIYHSSEHGWNTDVFRLDPFSARLRSVNLTKGSKAVDADADW